MPFCESKIQKFSVKSFYGCFSIFFRLDVEDFCIRVCVFFLLFFCFPRKIKYHKKISECIMLKPF